MTGLRIFPSVRTWHVDELNAAHPRPTWYFSVYPGTVESDFPADWRRVTRKEAVRLLWALAPDTLELYEPEWELWTWCVLALTYWLRKRGRPSRLAFYAIQNYGATSVLGGRLVWMRRRLEPLNNLLMRHLVGRLTDRIAFGSEAAAEHYELMMRPSIEVTNLSALRASRGDLPVKVPGSACFLAEVAERKGIPVLLKAWEQVELELDSAVLTIIGDGPLSPMVASWAAERAQSRRFLGRLPHSQALEHLRDTSVLVLPSQAWRGWREQIGDSIPEALSLGATIVTTTETGLASWLADRGHFVVDTARSAQDLGTVFCEALRNPLSAQEVRDTLPSEDGRLEADAWMHRAPVHDAD